MYPHGEVWVCDRLHGSKAAGKALAKFTWDWSSAPKHLAKSILIAMNRNLITVSHVDSIWQLLTHYANRTVDLLPFLH